MQKNNPLVQAIEVFATSWAPDWVVKWSKELETEIIHFANPDTQYVTPATSSYLMTSLLSAASLTTFYLISVFLLAVIVKIVAPNETKHDPKNRSIVTKFMKEPVLIIAVFYNIAQVALCSYMAYEAIATAYEKKYSLICNKFDLRDDSMGKIHWVFYMSKVLDMVDTYMIVLRRKWRQLSFLHVYHHSSIFAISWLEQRCGFDGDMYWAIFANSSVHIVMYFYYLMTALEVKVPKFLKVMVTNMQIIQFVSMLTQAIYIFVVDCPYPKRMLSLYFAYIASLLVLFVNFFIKSYVKSEKKEKTA